MFDSIEDRVQAWADLISVLKAAKSANENAEATGDEATIRNIGLAQAQRALRAAIRLFNTDPTIKAGGLVRAYAPLHSILHDVGRGARPPFLFEQTPQTSLSGRPTELMHDYVRADLAFALELLLAPVGGMSRKAALAWLVDAIHAQPFTAVWGDGDTSSSDGQFFRAGGHGEARADHNAHYGP